jgi:hypothetical protein
MKSNVEYIVADADLNTLERFSGKNAASVAEESYETNPLSYILARKIKGTDGHKDETEIIRQKDERPKKEKTYTPFRRRGEVNPRMKQTA